MNIFIATIQAFIISLIYFRYVYTRFRKSPVTSTYLLAFVVAQFNSAAATNTVSFPILVNYRTVMEDNVKTVTQYAQIMADAHEKFTGIPFADLGNPILNFIGLPVYGSSMSESWGLIVGQ